ncbi:TPA: acylphosphatase, partial [Klebsiella pneumoniae]|nr:acylphosphatase [Klebsiella pneumoniae]
MKIGRHFAVYGRVQGVGFRYQTFYWAKRHNVTGFVRNRQDGSVEI